MSAVAAIVIWTSTVTGCGSQSTTPADPTSRPPTAGAQSPAAGQPVELRPGRGLLLGTPIFDGDFADPFVLRVRATYYGYATNTEGANIPTLSFQPGQRARFLGDALPTLPTWSEPGFVWAPSVLAVSEGFVLYYSTRVRGLGRQCLSRAVSKSAAGPYVDDSTAPLVCQRDLGGTIDPSVVIDQGRPWLLYKNDGNCCDLPTSLWSRPLTSDGRSFAGAEHRLLTASQEWEAGLIEAPSMVARGDRFDLFYSANAWDTDRYAIGHAGCRSAAGPCRHERDPWMGSRPAARGPGGQEFFSAYGQTWMVYAAWREGAVGYPDGARRLYLDTVTWRAGRPVPSGRAGASVIVVIALGIGAALCAAALTRSRRRRRRRGRADTGPLAG